LLGLEPRCPFVFVFWSFYLMGTEKFGPSPRPKLIIKIHWETELKHEPRLNVSPSSKVP